MCYDEFTFTVMTPAPVLVYGVFFFSNRTWPHVARVSTYPCVFTPWFVEKNKGLLKCFGIYHKEHQFTQRWIRGYSDHKDYSIAVSAERYGAKSKIA